jgi:hypothetical protein
LGSDFDPKAQAEAAMKEAARAEGPERQRWIQVALAWIELGRPAPISPEPSGARRY